MVSFHFFESLTPGEELKLRENALKHVKTREWVFLERDDKDNSAVVTHKTGKFNMHVKEEDIDWEAYPRIKELFSKVKSGSR